MRRQTLKDTSSAAVTEHRLQTEVDRETEVEGSDLEDDTDNEDGSVDGDIWDRSVDPACMDAGYERDDSDVNKNI